MNDSAHWLEGVLRKGGEIRRGCGLPSQLSFSLRGLAESLRRPPESTRASWPTWWLSSSTFPVRIWAKWRARP